MITNLYGLKAITPTVLYLETATNDWWIGLIGAFIGGGASLLATVITHRYNLKQLEKERNDTELTTILSLSEELKVLMECYTAEFQNYFNRLDFNYYIKEYYNVTQEYCVVYKNNADKLGIIKDSKLRNLFIKIHIKITRFVEYLILYKEDLTIFQNRRIEILKMLSSEYNPDILKRVDLDDVFQKLRIDINTEKFFLENQTLKFQIEKALEVSEENEHILRSQCIDLKSYFLEIIEMNKKIQERTIDYILKQKI